MISILARCRGSGGADQSDRNRVFRAVLEKRGRICFFRVTVTEGCRGPTYWRVVECDRVVWSRFYLWRKKVFHQGGGNGSVHWRVVERYREGWTRRFHR